jgi:hypothetical protein
MASSDDPKDSSKQVSVPQHPLVEKLMAGATEPPSLAKIVGLIGKSTEPGNCRVYSSDLLTEYVEFPTTEIIHSESPGPGQSPLGPTTFWVRSDLPLRYTTVNTLMTQAAFLGGSISSGSASTGSTFQPMTALQSKVARTAHIICGASERASSCSDVCTPHQFTSAVSCGHTSVDSCGAPYPTSSGCGSTSTGCPDTFSCPPTTKGICS